MWLHLECTGMGEEDLIFCLGASVHPQVTELNPNKQNKTKIIGLERASVNTSCLWKIQEIIFHQQP